MKNIRLTPQLIRITLPVNFKRLISFFLASRSLHKIYRHEKEIKTRARRMHIECVKFTHDMCIFCFKAVCNIVSFFLSIHEYNLSYSFVNISYLLFICGNPLLKNTLKAFEGRQKNNITTDKPQCRNYHLVAPLEGRCWGLFILRGGSNC